MAAIALASIPLNAGATTLFGLIDTGELDASGDTGDTWQVRSALPVSDAVGLAAGGKNHTRLREGTGF